MMDDNGVKPTLEEVAALPQGDPLREGIEQHLSSGSEATRQRWDDLMTENEVYRQSLALVDVPEELTSRLLNLSEEPSALLTKRSRVSRRWLIGLTVAAALVTLLVGFGWIRHNANASRTRAIALLAVNNHLDHLEDHGIDPATDNKVGLEESLSDEVGFEVRVPSLGGGLEFDGGRKCKLGTHVVAFTLWHDDRGEYSLFQFEAERLGMPSTISPKLIRIKKPAVSEHECGAWIWTEGQYAYVLTGDPGVSLDSLSPKNAKR